MHRKNVIRATAGLIGLVGLVMPASPALAKGEPGSGVPGVSALPITSSGPLNRIELSADLACQVGYNGQAQGQFYPGGTGPADCGTFLATGGALYSPNFNAHADGTATSGLGAYTPFTPVTQTPQTGAGTLANPYIVTTVVNAGSSGLRVKRIDTYVRGQANYRSDVVVENVSTTTRGGILYHGFDCYLRGSDNGTGFAATNAATQTSRVGCASGKYLEQLVSLTAGNRYLESGYNTVWSTIGAKAVLPNTVQTPVHDNAAAISWEFSVPPNGSLIRSFRTEFVLPPARLSLDDDAVRVGLTGGVGENQFDVTFEVPRPI